MQVIAFHHILVIGGLRSIRWRT